MIDERLLKFFEKMEKDIELAKNRPPTKFEQLLDQYEEKFNDNAPTEPSSWSEEEWCEVLEECLEKNITVQELYGMDLENEIY